jgi:site-specific recombinase
MPSADAVLSAYPEAARSHRRVRELGNLFGAFLGAAEVGPAVDALCALGRWVREPDRRMPLPAGIPPETPATRRRLLAVIAVCEQPALAGPLRARIASFLTQSGGLALFAEAGLPSDRGLMHETADRLFRRLLPTPRDDQDLAAVLPRLFPGRAELAFLEGLEPDLFWRLCEVLGAGDPTAHVWDRLCAAVGDALVLLGARIAGLGLGEGIRDRGRDRSRDRSQVEPVSQSPFFVLPRAADRFLAHLSDPAPRIDAERTLRLAVEGCREELRRVTASLETAGISLDVVYTLEVIEQSLARLEKLLDVLSVVAGPERVAAAHRLLLVLVRARMADRSLRALAYSNLHLLARKLVERAGKTGEHYITSTRREYFAMLGRAAGGGVITALTAALKLQINSFGWPPFVAGFVSGINYSLSFILIQLCGFTLATKQPSMTAAALAGALGSGGHDQSVQSGRRAEIATQTARIVRSQLAAAIGNVITVSATAVAFDQLVRWRTGQPFLNPQRAAAVLDSFHPTHSGTAWYAIVTGVILWAASLVGGWVENFAVCRRLPQAIAEHPLGRIVGRRTLRVASEFFARQISGLGVSVALGMMLGMAPSLGAFFGLPLDVRHVTLSTGQLALALAESGMAGLHRPQALLAIAGIGVTFVLNLGTSFSLALAVAVRAREIRRRDRWGLFLAIAGRLARHPFEFIWPPGR